MYSLFLLSLLVHLSAMAAISDRAMSRTGSYKSSCAHHERARWQLRDTGEGEACKALAHSRLWNRPLVPPDDLDEQKKGHHGPELMGDCALDHVGSGGMLTLDARHTLLLIVASWSQSYQGRVTLPANWCAGSQG